MRISAAVALVALILVGSGQGLYLSEWNVTSYLPHFNLTSLFGTRSEGLQKLEDRQDTVSLGSLWNNHIGTAGELWQKNLELTKEWGNFFLNVLNQKKDMAVNAISKGGEMIGDFWNRVNNGNTHPPSPLSPPPTEIVLPRRVQY